LAQLHRRGVRALDRAAREGLRLLREGLPVILKDDVVVITGVGAGLGAKLAKRAVDEGAKVVMAARSGGVTEQIEKETDGKAVAVQCDVRKEEDCQRVVDTAIERFGKITGLVNSAYAHPGFFDLL